MKMPVPLTIVTFRPDTMIIVCGEGRLWGKRSEKTVKIEFFMISGGSESKKKIGDLPNIYITSLNFTAYKNECYGSPNVHRAVIIGA